MKAAIFSHFDIDDMVDDYVLFSLRCYRQYFDQIVFVSTSSLDAEQQLRALSLSDVVICRENVGYDFGSWRCGFETLDLDKFDSVTFINDSIYGPCNDISFLMQEFDRSQSDLWGISINHQFAEHVQSYFMRFNINLLRSGFAEKFWSSVAIYENKIDIILQNEVGLSQKVVSAGFSIGALVNLNYLNRSLRDVVSRENRPVQMTEDWISTEKIILLDDKPNPVQLFWGELFRMGAPFVKTEIFKTNPMHVNRLSILNRIRSDKRFDVSLIQKHLERVNPFDKSIVF